MFNNQQVIDVHGHMSTPPEFRAYAYNLIALRSPGDGALEIPEEMMKPALDRHFRILDERRIDIQMISPRPIAMMHWERPFIVEKWTHTTNDIIHQQCKKHPDRFVGIAQLPQNSKLDTKNCVAEFERCVKELGFVGALLNPDPGGDRQTPGVNTEYWFPLYEKAQALGVPLIVHPSSSRDPRIEIIPHNYQINNVVEEYIATLLFQHGNVFEIFPQLKVIVCHCGGVLSRMIAARKARESKEQAGGLVGIPLRRQRVEREKEWNDNLFFDTCAYDKDFLATAIKQRGVDQMLFGTEAPGTGTSVINPDTGKPSDDIVPVIDSIEFLSHDDKMKIFRENALRLFPKLKERVQPMAQAKTA